MSTRKKNSGDAEQAQNRLEITIEECKGCGRCVRACPRQLLQMSAEFNRRGYHYAVYEGEGCIGCGRCFYTCPEPHAIKLFKKMIVQIQKKRPVT